MSKHSIITDNQVEKLKGVREPIIYKCAKEVDGHLELCSKVEDDIYCRCYAFPIAKWRLGECNMADQNLKAVTVVEKKKVNPIKASKKARRGK